MTTPSEHISAKLWRLLTPSQRKRAGLLVGLMLLAMTLEILGIGLVIPALAVLSQSDIARQFPALARLLSAMGTPTPQQLAVTTMLLLVGVYAFKALFLAFSAWQQSRFIFDLQADLSQKLFVIYLRQPYTFHLQRNSAQLIRNVTNEISQFVSAIQSSMELTSETLVVLGVGILLLAVEPLGAVLVMTSLGIAAWTFNRLTRFHSVRWGAAKQYHDGLRIQHLQQGLGGAKDVKLLGREDDFLNHYNQHNQGSARLAQRQNTLQHLPRLWLELLAVIGLALLVIVMVSSGKPMESVLPTLGLFAASAFRLLPSINRILTSIQGIRYSSSVIENLHTELHLTYPPSPAGNPALLPFQKSLKLQSVSFAYPSTQHPSVIDVEIDIPPGASVGLIGGSGAGKSTLVDIIMGLLPPDSGTVTVDDRDIATNLRGWQDQIGYVPQSIFLTDDTLRRNVAFGLPAGDIDDDAVRRAIHAAQLTEFVNELPDGLDTIVGERGVRLSGGQRQRIGIARALYHDPSVLVLDEATSALDTATESGVMEAVRTLHGKKTIIVIAHRLSTVGECDWLYRLEKGRIVAQGTAQQMLHQVPEETIGDGNLIGEINRV